MRAGVLGAVVAGRLRYLAIAVPIVIGNNLIHEGAHYALARACGERVREVRVLTNGWGTSQVINETPVEQRVGAHWLLIAWVPSAVTTGLGYLLWAVRRRFHGRRPLAAAGLYAGFFFLLIDPVYLSVLSWVVGGDAEAAAAVGWPPWSVRLVALPVFLVNAWLVRGWLLEARVTSGS